MAIRLERVLLPTDFSDYSAAATMYACELAAKFDAELHLLHTLEVHLSGTPGFGMGLALPQYLHESRAAAGKALDGVLDPQWAVGRKVVRAVVEGSPKVEIVRYARTQEVDLIVLATHGRSGLAHVIIGSVAESVVRTAPCPVLTVRPEGTSSSCRDVRVDSRSRQPQALSPSGAQVDPLLHPGGNLTLLC
jgi:nucleotide-binding universal stress UspA family protein